MAEQSAVIPIHVDLHAGPGSVRRESFACDSVTFGRDPVCDLPLASTFASRRQGELRFENGQWWLVNQGQNPVHLNGKPVAGRPRALTEHSVVTLGDEPAFEVFLHVPAEAQASSLPAAPTIAAAPLRRRAGIFVAIGGAWALAIILAVFLTLMPSQNGAPAMAPELSAAQIQSAIRAPLPSVPVDPRQSRQYLLQARETSEREDSRPDALFRAHELYRLALAHSGEPQFAEGIDQRRYLDVQQRLIDRVAELHRDGYARLRSGQYREAEATFRRLQQEYPAPTSDMFRNAESQRRYASANIGRRQRR
jgi:hypothetical protein